MTMPFKGTYFYKDLFIIYLAKTFKKSSSHEPCTGLNYASMFGLDHPQDQEIQDCSNKVPAGVTIGYTLRRHTFIQVFISKTFKIFRS